MKRTLGLGLAVVVAFGASHAHATDKAETKVTFDRVSQSGSPGGLVAVYEGSVKSSKKACKEERRIAAFRKLPGKDRKMGSARARPVFEEPGEWGWTVEEDGKLEIGKYYARARSTEDCAGDTSNVYELSPPRSAARADTKVTFENATSPQGFNGAVYSGTVSSPRNACADGRKIVVKSGDGRIGADRARKNDDGKYVWKVKVPGPPMAGYYHARAKRTDECAGDRSKDYLFA